MTVLLMSAALGGVLLALLAGVMFLALLYQPDLVWIASGLTMLAAFISLALIPAERRRLATTIIYAAPASYSVFWIILAAQVPMLSNSSLGWSDAVPILLWTLLLYFLGALLLYFLRRVALEVQA